MTKSELTNLLGLENLVKANAKSKAHNTMLDVISYFLTVMKSHQGGVSLPTAGGEAKAIISSAQKSSAHRGMTPSTDATQASVTSIPQQYEVKQ